MKERLITLGLACIALFLFYALFLPKRTPPTEHVSQPLSNESGPNGYVALQRWLDAEHIRVASLRRRYDRLNDLVHAQQGNLLITTMPHRLAARLTETRRLREWIAQGNTLLVMAGLADTPDWSMDGAHSGKLIDNLRDLIGVTFYATNRPDKNARRESGSKGKSDRNGQSDKLKDGEQFVDVLKKLLKPKERTFVPTVQHPLTSGVQRVDAVSEYPADEWGARPADRSTAVLELARSPSDRDASSALWLVNYGKGQIIVSAFASPFENKLIGMHDNARLFANIVVWSVGTGGAVIFDDMHQGLSALYDPKAFFGDPRLHHTLIWLLVVWLVFLLGPSRMRVAASKWNPVDIMSFVRATGGFMARTLKPAEASRRELTLFFNTIRRRLGLPENGAPVWEWLSVQGRVATNDVAELRGYYERIARGSRVDFVELHNLLTRITGSFV